MSANERGSLKAAFSNFRKPESDKDAELKLLGRQVEKDAQAPASSKTQAEADSYQIATSSLPAGTPGGLTPRPLLQREAVRQLSFRCPVSIASELRRKAAYNQLEQQEIIIEGIKRILIDLPDPPSGWQG